MSTFQNTIDLLGDEELTAKLVGRQLTEFNDNVISVIAQKAFGGSSTNTTNTALVTVRLLNLKRVPTYAFGYCYNLKTVELENTTNIDSSAFHECWKLSTLVLRGQTMCSAFSKELNDTPIASGLGYIYVPRSLVDTYKAATNWSVYAAQFRTLEDWTVDGTTTGEFDPNRHMVRFFNEDGTLLGYVVVPTGGNAVYPGNEPVKEGEYAFRGWEPAPNNVTTDMDCYAKFAYTGYYYSKIIDRSISGEYTNALATSVGISAFDGCNRLTTADFPAATSIGDSAFYSCYGMVSANFPLATSIGSAAFSGCNMLTALILRSETVCSLGNKSAFTSTPIASGTGYIYVPRALVDTYKSATNWSTYAAKFRALEDYTVDGTTTGALDKSKI